MNYGFGRGVELARRATWQGPGQITGRPMQAAPQMPGMMGRMPQQQFGRMPNRLAQPMGGFMSRRNLLA